MVLYDIFIILLASFDYAYPTVNQKYGLIALIFKFTLPFTSFLSQMILYFVLKSHEESLKGVVMMDKDGAKSLL